MITGLDVTGSVYPHKYKGSSMQTGVKTGVGYKRYIQKYMSDGPLFEVEYRAFLNMWLCRFIFCGKAVGHTPRVLMQGRKKTDSY
jgi:hypothetical protein